MPEGDTVFKLAGYLRAELGGRRLAAGAVRGRPDAALAGARIGEVYARGKHLFIELGGGRLLRSHLGMWGSWHGYLPHERWHKPRRQASIVLDLGERVFVCFNALEVEILRDAGVRQRKLDVVLGPDLLAPAPDFDLIVRRARELAAVDTLVVDVLLDQRIACGVGNVYKSEVLFVEGRHPQTPLGALDDPALDALYRQAARLLRRNVHGGPRVTRRANDRAGRLWVYGRSGRPCLHCDVVIASARLGRGQRSSFWCPACQRISVL
jgi:endonuclease-8